MLLCLAGAACSVLCVRPWVGWRRRCCWRCCWRCRVCVGRGPAGGRGNLCLGVWLASVAVAAAAPLIVSLLMDLWVVACVGAHGGGAQGAGHSGLPASPSSASWLGSPGASSESTSCNAQLPKGSPRLRPQLPSQARRLHAHWAAVWGQLGSRAARPCVLPQHRSWGGALGIGRAVEVVATRAALVLAAPPPLRPTPHLPRLRHGNDPLASATASTSPATSATRVGAIHTATTSVLTILRWAACIRLILLEQPAPSSSLLPPPLPTTILRRASRGHLPAPAAAAATPEPTPPPCPTITPRSRPPQPQQRSLCAHRHLAGCGVHHQLPACRSCHLPASHRAARLQQLPPHRCSICWLLAAGLWSSPPSRPRVPPSPHHPRPQQRT